MTDVEKLKREVQQHLFPEHDHGHISARHINNAIDYLHQRGLLAAKCKCCTDPETVIMHKSVADKLMDGVVGLNKNWEYHFYAEIKDGKLIQLVNAEATREDVMRALFPATPGPKKCRSVMQRHRMGGKPGADSKCPYCLPAGSNRFHHPKNCPMRGLYPRGHIGYSEECDRCDEQIPIASNNPPEIINKPACVSSVEGNLHQAEPPSALHNEICIKRDGVNGDE